MIDEGLFHLCNDYIRLFLVFHELCRLNDDYDDLDLDDIIDGFNVNLGRIVNDMLIYIFKVKYINIDKEYIESIDRFNYSIDMSGMSVVKDNLSDFKVRVNVDDVDRLDSMLNGLYSDLVNMERANHNLHRELVRFIRLVDSLMDDSSEESVLNVLESLRERIYFYEDDE